MNDEGMGLGVALNGHSLLNSIFLNLKFIKRDWKKKKLPYVTHLLKVWGESQNVPKEQKQTVLIYMDTDDTADIGTTY